MEIKVNCLYIFFWANIFYRGNFLGCLNVSYAIGYSSDHVWIISEKKRLKCEKLTTMDVRLGTKSHVSLRRVLKPVFSGVDLRKKIMGQ